MGRPKGSKDIKGDLLEKIKTDYFTGVFTHKQIGERNGISWDNICRIANRYGWANMGCANTRRTSNEDIEEIKKRRLLGETLTEISQNTGVNPRIVSRYLKRMGLVVKKAIEGEKLEEAIRLYEKQLMSPARIANILELNERTLKAALKRKGITRTKSEASSISVICRKKHGKGGYWQSSKDGTWQPADSKMELFRMSMLDADVKIKTWTRTVPIIPYDGNRNYRPDFYIEYEDGRKVVEEIKPLYQHTQEINKMKWEAAQKFCRELGFEFRVVSENEMGGAKAIQKFIITGLQQPSFEQRSQIAKQRIKESQARSFKRRYIPKDQREATD